jgi:hypothetical protein
VIADKEGRKMVDRYTKVVLTVFAGALLVGLVLAFICWQPATREAYAATPMGTVGRYQVFFGPMLAKQSFLVDTVTGRSWMMVADEKGDSVWQQMECFPLPPEMRQRGTP